MEEGLDVTLDGSMVHIRRWIQGEKFDANMQSIKKIDFVLDCLEIEELI